MPEDRKALGSSTPEFGPSPPSAGCAAWVLPAGPPEPPRNASDLPLAAPRETAQLPAGPGVYTGVAPLSSAQLFRSDPEGRREIGARWAAGGGGEPGRPLAPSQARSQSPSQAEPRTRFPCRPRVRPGRATPFRGERPALHYLPVMAPPGPAGAPRGSDGTQRLTPAGERERAGGQPWRETPPWPAAASLCLSCSPLWAGAADPLAPGSASSPAHTFPIKGMKREMMKRQGLDSPPPREKPSRNQTRGQHPPMITPLQEKR